MISFAKVITILCMCLNIKVSSLGKVAIALVFRPSKGYRHGSKTSSALDKPPLFNMLSESVYSVVNATGIHSKANVIG